MEQDRKVVTGIVAGNNRIAGGNAGYNARGSAGGSAGGIYEMVIKTDVCKDFIAGQFINIYLNDRSMLLPRPISISEASAENVTIVYRTVGKGTELLAAYSAGERVRMSSPLGNGFSLKEDYSGKHLALVAGGIGLPPMIGLAGVLKKRNASVNVFLGFQSEVFLTAKFEQTACCLSFSTEDGSAGFHGNVVELLMENNSIYDEYFACGPRGMLKALCDYTAKTERGVQVSLEERMGCGYGACLGCSCDVKEGAKAVKKSVCKHGPVFAGNEVAWD